MDENFNSYRPSIRTAWAAVKPKRLWWGIADVLLHPGRSFESCGDAQRVTVWRAFMFALIVTLTPILLWRMLRELVLGIPMLGADSNEPFKEILRQCFAFRNYPRVWQWEGFSIARWYLAFGFMLAVSVFLSRRDTLGSVVRNRWTAATCRLLLFAPWIALLDIGYLCGARLLEPRAVMEPATVFLWDWKFWLERSALPTIAIGFVFFQFVLRIKRLPAILLAMALIPFFALLSMAWSQLYVVLRTR